MAKGKSTALKDSTFNAVLNSKVAKGTCVIVEAGVILYSGRLGDAPTPVNGQYVHLHPRDYEKLSLFVKKRRH